jgi:hypothetical protein
MSIEIGREYLEYFQKNLRFIHLPECYHKLTEHLGLTDFARMCIDIGGLCKGVPHVKSIKPLLHIYIKEHSIKDVDKLSSELNMSREYIAKVLRR